MKYFTPEWWSSGCVEDVWSEYLRYIDSVKDHLPNAALVFDANHTLHDSEIKQIGSDFGKREVKLTLHGWDTRFATKTRYWLTFHEVLIFEQCYPQEEYVESELGDLGYWEWEAIPTGTELRLLFVSSALFRLRFKEFSFEFEALPA